MIAGVSAPGETQARGKLGRSLSVGLVGMTGHVVDVEAHLANGVPGFVIVGLPDASLAEARDRVRAAMSCSGLKLPQRRITVNLAPASLPKRGSGFDVAIAVALLGAALVVDSERAASTVCLGELGLDGRVHPIRGILPAVVAAVAAGVRRIIVPEQNAVEAGLVPGAEIISVRTLLEVARNLGADVQCPVDVAVASQIPANGPVRAPAPDLAEVVGQHEARHALEIAAAGGHHLFMVGAPGTGKTMLAQRLPTILPDLSDDHAVEVTAIHSLAGTLDASAGLIRRPPFESPHHTATAAALIGGGSGLPRPGAVSLAHRGLLFLDEAPEFSARVLQTLRQPIEAGELSIHRSGGTARYPARFQLVMAANPCPCGKALDDCGCTSLVQRRYFARLSGPLLDRVDLHCHVSPTGIGTLRGAGGESSAIVARRVAEARQAAGERLRGTGWTLNSQVSGSWLRERWGANPATLAPLHKAISAGQVSMRAADRVVRVAWTMADLAGRGSPGREEIDAALAMRSVGPMR